MNNIASGKVWLTTHNWGAQLDGQLDVIGSDLARYDISLFPLDYLLHFVESFGGVQHGLGKRQVPLESWIILRHYNVETRFWVLNFDELEDFQIILVDLIRQRVRADVDNIDIRVLDREDAHDLRILLLLQLLYREAAQLCD